MKKSIPNGDVEKLYMEVAKQHSHFTGEKGFTAVAAEAQKIYEAPASGLEKSELCQFQYMVDKKIPPTVWEASPDIGWRGLNMGKKNPSDSSNANINILSLVEVGGKSVLAER